MVFYAWEDVGNLPAFDRADCAAAIGKLGAGNWTFTEDDYVTGAILDDAGDATKPTKLRLFRLRSGDGVPHKLDSARQIAAIVLARGESVTDFTHVVLWGDGYMAHDAGRDAPGPSRLARYIKERASQNIDFVSLYDRDLIKRLEGLDEVKAIELKLLMSRVDQIDKSKRKGLLGGLIRLGGSAQAAEISAKVSVGRKRKTFLNSDVHDELKGLAADAADFLDQMTVTGIKDGETVYIDMLKQRLQVPVQVKRAGVDVSYPDVDAMYDAILGARQGLGTRLASAARVV